MTNKEIANTILNQLGGNKFIVMTGSKDFLALSQNGNMEGGLGMKLARNKSKANRLDIILNWDDTYTMRFYKFTSSRLDKKTYEFIDCKSVDVKVYEHVFCDQLCELFEMTTGLYTSL